MSYVIMNECLSFHSAFKINKNKIHRSGVLDSAIWLLHGWCQAKLLPSRRTFCVHRTTMRQLTASLHSKPDMQGACVFSRSLPPAPLAERPGSFTCFCGNTGVERIPKLETAQKVDPGEENYPGAPAGTRTWDLSITRPSLCHRATPCPLLWTSGAPGRYDADNWDCS